MSDTTETVDIMSSIHNSIVVPCAVCNNDSSAINQIQVLEEEVRFLTDKAAAAADRLADYEEEISRLKGGRNDSPVNYDDDAEGDGSRKNRISLHLIPEHIRPDIQRMVSAPNATTGRFSFLSNSRKPLPTRPSSKGDVAELEAALAKETHLRQEAEKKVKDVENEIEDLSATLFEQANEMVATERRTNAQLQEKIAQLEQRDRERSKRLDRIDEAMRRIERVQILLNS